MNQEANTVRKAIYTHLTTILKDSKCAIVTSRRSKDQLERGEGEEKKERREEGGKARKKKYGVCVPSLQVTWFKTH